MRRNQLVLRPAHVRPQLAPANPQAHRPAGEGKSHTRHEHKFYDLQGPQGERPHEGSGVGRRSRRKGIYEGRTRTLFQ